MKLQLFVCPLSIHPFLFLEELRSFIHSAFQFSLGPFAEICLSVKRPPLWPSGRDSLKWINWGADASVDLQRLMYKERFQLCDPHHRRRGGLLIGASEV